MKKGMNIVIVVLAMIGAAVLIALLGMWLMHGSMMDGMGMMDGNMMGR